MTVGTLETVLVNALTDYRQRSNFGLKKIGIVQYFTKNLGRKLGNTPTKQRQDITRSLVCVVNPIQTSTQQECKTRVGTPLIVVGRILPAL